MPNTVRQNRVLATRAPISFTTLTHIFYLMASSFKDLLSKFKAPRSDEPVESDVKKVEEPPKAAKLLADIENFKQSR